MLEEEKKRKGVVKPPSAERRQQHLSLVSDVRTAHLLNEPLMAALIELV